MLLDLIDFILNIAGLLLWLNWRTLRLDPINRLTPATLAGTVRRTEPMRLQRWHFLAALGALLFVRAVFYGQLGPAVNWTPKLNLTIIALAFPLTHGGHVFYRSALLFSVLSFVLVLIIFYVWLLALAVINRRVTNPDPFQKLLLLQLGRPARWPLIVQAALPFVGGTALWMLCHPLLVHTGVISPVRTNPVLLAQGLILSLNAYLSLRFLLVGILLMHVIASYIYLGNNPVWDFINTTSRNILSLNWLPLRIGKFDLAPLAAVAVIVLLFYWPVPGKISHTLDKHNLTLWPH